MTELVNHLRNFGKNFSMTAVHVAWVALALVGVGMFSINKLAGYLAPTDWLTWFYTTPLGALTFSAAVYGVTLLFVLSPMIMRRKSKTEVREALGLKKPLQFRMVLWALMMQGIFIGVAMVVTLILYSLNISGLDLTERQELPFAELSGWYEYVAAFVLLVVLAPVFEEMIFRGYLYGRLRKYSGVIISTIITSIGFGVVHGQLNVAIVVGLLSVAMCVLREKFDSIYPTIMMHMFQNGFSYAMLFIVPLYGIKILQ